MLRRMQQAMAIAAIIGLAVGVSYARTTGREVVFSEDFDDGVADGFFFDSSGWQVSGGALQQTDGCLSDDPDATIVDGVWTDMEVSARIRLDSICPSEP